MRRYTLAMTVYLLAAATGIFGIGTQNLWIVGAAFLLCAAALVITLGNDLTH